MRKTIFDDYSTVFGKRQPAANIFCICGRRIVAADDSLRFNLPETSALPTTGKKLENAKKRGFRPEKSGGSPAVADSAAVYRLDIYGKNVCRILSPKARKPAWILRKIGWHLFCHPIMVRVRGLEPPWNCFHMDLNHTRLPIPPYPHILFVNRGDSYRF